MDDDDDENDYSSFFRSDGDEQVASPSPAPSTLEAVVVDPALAVGGMPPLMNGAIANDNNSNGGGYIKGYIDGHRGGVHNNNSDQPSCSDLPPLHDGNAEETMALSSSSSSSTNPAAESLMLQEASFPNSNQQHNHHQQQQQGEGEGNNNNNNSAIMMQSNHSTEALILSPYEDTGTLANSLDQYLETAFQSEEGGVPTATAAPATAAAAATAMPTTASTSALAPMNNDDENDDDSDVTEVIRNMKIIPPPPLPRKRQQQHDEIEIGSWSSDSEIEVIEPSDWKGQPPNGSRSGALSAYTSSTTMAVPSSATASFYSRNQHMPQWMMNSSSAAAAAAGSTPTGGATTTSAINNYSYPPPPPSSNSHQQQHSSQPYAASSSSSHQYYPHQQQHHQQIPSPISYVQIPSSHTPTWSDILPKDYYRHNVQPVQNRYQNSYTPRKKLSLSLINMWEFTITIESLDYGYSAYGSGGGGYSGGYGGYASGHGGNNENRHEAITGLRAQIKKIAREHTGRDGRKGAIFEKGSMGEGIVPEDPLLKGHAEEEPENENGGASAGGGAAGGGRWRIPLGAYHSLMTYLTSDANNDVDGIPPEQLRAATLGRERMDKKTYATVPELISRNVSPVVASALAPYQRGGVEFILDKEGRALMADEMGLGKTVQAIAAMSAYRKSDWPLLVLCPSTARYHWETEFRCWMGSEAKARLEQEAKNSATAEGDGGAKGGGGKSMWPDNNKDDGNALLKNSQINVLTSGRDTILKTKSTAIVICSIGLIVNLASSGRIRPGMFRAVIVDESHALKSKSTKRTRTVLPLLKAAERCLLLSGTPALARPCELWPQLSVLGGRRRGRGGGSGEDSSGIWCDEAEFMKNYVKPKGEENNKTRLAELHTLLTSTVMIRRMKADILKNLPSKIREKAYVNIKDVNLANEFGIYMQLLRQGRGVLGKLARAHHDQQHPSPPPADDAPPAAAESTEMEEPRAGQDGVRQMKQVLHHLYSITGRSKIARVAKMLASWLADPTKGKLCIFAHHLEVLDGISTIARLDNRKGSLNKYIRIDGSTSPKARQEQILQFQTDPKVRIAMLGITAAGVAVTLTASSTVWFAELFWTPAIMIQAEDRCHRIGQQARVRCLYFIGRGTLDDVLWKLIEKKFRDLGQFVEGKDNMDIALERELEDGEEDEILKTEDNGDNDGDGGGGTGKKRKAQDVFNELFDAEDLELKKEIDEMCHEEEDMLNVKNNEEEEELIEPPDVVVDESKASAAGDDVPVKQSATGDTAKQQPGSSSDMVIELLDDDDDNNKPQAPTIANIRELYRSTGILAKLKIYPHVQFNNLRLYTLQYSGPSYGLIMVACNGRVVVKAHHHNPEQNNNNDGKNHHPEIGSIIVGVNGYLIPYNASFVKVLALMKHMMRTPPVTVMFAEDYDFTSMFVEDFLPNLPVRRVPTTMEASASSSSSSVVAVASSSAASSSSRQIPPLPRQQNSEVIDLLDDD